jgi:hypothetical protein
MKIKAFIFLFVSSLAFFSVKNNKDINYWAKHGFYHLTLKDDSTFLLTYHVGYHLKYTWGRWHKAGNDYHLKGAFKDLNSIPVKVDESRVEDGDSITFVLSTNMKSGYSLDKIQLLLDSVPFCLKTGTLKVHSQYDFSTIRLRTYIDHSYVDSGYIVTPYYLNDEIFSEEYLLRCNESNYFEIHWGIDGKIYRYDQIERITLKKRINKLFWVERNVTFSKSRKR